MINLGTRRRRSLAMALLCFALAVPAVVVPAAPAYAYTCLNGVPCETIPAALDTSLKSVLPGAALAGVLAAVPGQSRATAAISWDLHELQSDQPHAMIWTVGTDTTNLVKEIPLVGNAYTAGLAIGSNWLDPLLGISTSIAPGVTPNSDVVVPPNTGWVNGGPFAQTTTGSSPLSYTNVYPDASNWPCAYRQAVTSCTSNANELLLDFSVNATSSNRGLIDMSFVCYTSTAATGGTVSAPSPAHNFQLYGSGSNTQFAATSGNFTFRFVTAPSPSQPCSASPYFDHLEIRTYTYYDSGTSHTDTVSSVSDWYPSGHPSRPAAPVSDPRRDYWMHTVCHDSFVIDTRTSSFHETDAAFPALPAPGDCSAHGGIIHSWTLYEENLDAGTNRVLKGPNVTPSSIENLGTTYSECLGHEPWAGSSTPCVTTLWKASTGKSTGWEDCFTSGDDCAGWANDSTRTTDYKCTYGLPSESAVQAHDVGLSGCYQYGNTFDTSARNSGQVFTDPSVDPGTQPATGNDPNGDLSAPAGATQSSPGAGYCNFSWGLIFNPLQWVVQPLECAFIPSEAQLQALQTRMTSDYSGTSVGAWVSAIGGLFGSLGGSGSDCTGPSVTFPLTSPPKVLQPFNACSDPMKTVASISYAFSTVVIVVFGAMAGMRAVGSAFGYQFSLGERLKASE